MYTRVIHTPYQIGRIMKSLHNCNCIRLKTRQFIEFWKNPKLSTDNNWETCIRLIAISRRRWHDRSTVEGCLRGKFRNDWPPLHVFGELCSKFSEIRRMRKCERTWPNSVTSELLSFSYLACWVVGSLASLSFPHLVSMRSSASEPRCPGGCEMRPRPIARVFRRCFRATFWRKRASSFFAQRCRFSRCMRITREPREMQPYSLRLGRDWQWERAIGAFTSHAGFLRGSHTISLRWFSHEGSFQTWSIHWIHLVLYQNIFNDFLYEKNCFMSWSIKNLDIDLNIILLNH